MAGGDHKEEPYQPQDALKLTTQAALTFGGFGLFTAAIQSAVQRQPVGAMATFTRYGHTITTFTMVGSVYEFARTASANLRQKDDHYNHAIGGFLGGSILGIPSRRLPQMVGWGAAFSVIMTTYIYTGASLRGWGTRSEEDEFERKEYLRRNRRRPIEETIAEIGEGRGIHPPGYEERRRQRLKEKYGVIINPVSADPNQPAPSAV